MKTKKMTELKTLKDLRNKYPKRVFTHEDSCMLAGMEQFGNDLKQEAIKWAKDIMEPKEGDRIYDFFNRKAYVCPFIFKFFNLTKDDFK